MIGEEVLQHQFNAVSDDEGEMEASKGKPPVVDEEELAKLDAEAWTPSCRQFQLPEEADGDHREGHHHSPRSTAHQRAGQVDEG